MPQNPTNFSFKPGPSPVCLKFSRDLLLFRNSTYQFSAYVWHFHLSLTLTITLNVSSLMPIFSLGSRVVGVAFSREAIWEPPGRSSTASLMLCRILGLWADVADASTLDNKTERTRGTSFWPGWQGCTPLGVGVTLTVFILGDGTAWCAVEENIMTDDILLVSREPLKFWSKFILRWGVSIKCQWWGCRKDETWVSQS